MEAWQVAVAANVLVSVAYMAICAAIVMPLVRTSELFTNRLGTATALIFFSCSVGHGGHALMLLLPGVASGHGEMMRDAFPPWQAAWDLTTAAVAVYYWTLRRSYGRLLISGTLFGNQGERQREALELNDAIVQGLVTAKMAHRHGKPQQLEQALDSTLLAARSIVDTMLAEAQGSRPLAAGDFVRTDETREAGRP